MKRVLILKEKHGSWYFDVSTNDLLHKACLKVVIQRNNEDWYCDLSGEEPIPPKTTLEDVKHLDPSHAELVKESWKQYKQDKRVYNNNKLMRTLLKQSLIGNDESAYKFLCHRADGEYEDFKIATLDSIYEVYKRKI